MHSNFCTVTGHHGNFCTVTRNHGNFCTVPRNHGNFCTATRNHGNAQYLHVVLLHKKCMCVVCLSATAERRAGITAVGEQEKQSNMTSEPLDAQGQIPEMDSRRPR